MLLRFGRVWRAPWEGLSPVAEHRYAGATAHRPSCPIPTSTTSTGTGTDQLCAHYATLLYGQVWRATTISEQFVMRFESCCAIRLTFASAAGRIFYLLRTYRLLRFQGAKIQNKE
jgi:hypothetical protein